MCLHGSMDPSKYGHVHLTMRRSSSSCNETSYRRVPRTLAENRSESDRIVETRPLRKYDSPRLRDAWLTNRRTVAASVRGMTLRGKSRLYRPIQFNERPPGLHAHRS